MNNYEQIVQKLEAFIKKYYTNELIKGGLFFMSIGLLYFLLIVGLEYFLWLSSSTRTLLFWLFIGVELALFARFIVYPLSKLFKLSKGIGYVEASQIIGQHFPEVKDKLLNVIQLNAHASNAASELVMASIDQKSVELQPIPFQVAVNFKANLKYLKFAVIPLLIIGAIYLSGQYDLFSDSYSRVVNYKTEYEPPAPFRFRVMNEDLKVRENESLQLTIKTEGEILPDQASIVVDGNAYILKKTAPNTFTYQFDRLKQDHEFYFKANDVQSKPYQLQLIQVPTLLDFEMTLTYPAYLQKENERIKGTGNATIPEGTRVSWNLKTRSTDAVDLQLKDSLIAFEQTENRFTHSQAIYQSQAYQLQTSNAQVKHYEQLSYSFQVIKDAFPAIDVQVKEDSISQDQLYFLGRLRDDYGLQRLQVVYHPEDNEQAVKRRSIAISKTNFEEFVYVFPGDIAVEAGVPYSVYFEVFDNDGVNGSKSAKSTRFVYRKRTQDEEENRQLQQQSKMLEGMDESLKKMQESQADLEEIDRMQKEKSQMNYNDRKKFEQFLENQQRERQKMEDYSKQMKENLEKFKADDQDPFKKELEERFERNEKKLEENEELLKELEKYNEKLSREKLTKELEKLSKQNINQQKNLEQLLELTKRYYVQEKAKKIADDLQKLGEKQEQLSKKDQENTPEAQEEMNKAFEDLQREMDSLQQENKKLKTPMELGNDKKERESIKKDQQEATESLKKSESEEGQEPSKESSEEQNQEQQSNKAEQSGAQQQSSPQKQNAQQKQQSAGQKMKKMGQGMQMQMMQSGSEQQQEDADMLRQILDNLITYSFEQEKVMKDFDNMPDNSPNFGKKLREQQSLRENFEFIDDSLYALALRNPMISDKITQKLTDVEFNIDKALERLAQNDMRVGVANQQYALTGANDLANMLGDALNQMQNQMQMSGSGQGSSGQPKPGQGQGGRGFQLPDIIKKQGELNQQMQNGQKPGEKGGEQEGEGQSDSSGQGKSGEGKSGEGQENQQGSERKSGQMGQNGEEQSERLFEIYKEQQRLRSQLEDLIRREGLGDDAKQLAKSMEQVEQELLNKGLTRSTEEQMLNVEHRLLQLKNASFKQEKDNQRQSQSNNQQYENELRKNYEKAREYFNTTEILNRQSLPLRQNYKELVERYFNQND